MKNTDHKPRLIVINGVWAAFNFKGGYDGYANIESRFFMLYSANRFRTGMRMPFQEDRVQKAKELMQ